jgi:hypothetical protein
MAVLNAEVLNQNIVDWVGHPDRQPAFPITQRYDAKSHCVVFEAGPVENLFPIMWGLLLGDIVHDYRSCLDHTAWALYQRGNPPTGSDYEKSGVYFPITKSNDDFNAELRGRRPKLPGVRRADIAIVRRYQPYSRGESRAPSHVFSILKNLSDADKHRVIQPVIPVPEEAHYKLLTYQSCEITRYALRARKATLQEGTELGRIYVRRDRRGGPDPQVEVQPHFSIYPAVYERTPSSDGS